MGNLASVHVHRPEPYLTQQGDVLFLTRGYRLYAAVVPDVNTDTIATSYFVVLRPNGRVVLPNDLAWSMNQPDFQKSLRPFLRGTHMPMIAKADVEDLKIRVLFAAGAGLVAGEFYTPEEMFILLAKLVQPKPGDRIYDPACGSGSLLIQVTEEVKEPDGKPSREFQDDKRQNRLRSQDIDKIVATYKAYRSVSKYAHRATLAEIRENEFNLNIPRYVDTSEEEEIDVAALQKENERLEAELAQNRQQMAVYLKELGYGA